MSCVLAVLIFLGAWMLAFLIFGGDTSWSHGGTFHKLTGVLSIIPVIPAIVAYIAYGIVEKSLERAENAKSRAELAKNEQLREQTAAQEQQRRAALSASGHVVFLKDAPNRMVTCSNRHHYMFCDFQVKHSAIERDRWDGSYYTDHWNEMGCPTCKTKLLQFDNISGVDYRVCDRCRCAFGLNKYDTCPVCGR